jgi:site-specific DNA-cytosine methylase
MPSKITFPCVLQKQRSEQGKIIRRQFKNDIGIPYTACKCLVPRTDGICGTITTFTTDNNIAIELNIPPNMEYKPHPTKEDLLAYFGQRIRIRKMTEIEAMRLMDVEDSDIQKVQQAGIAKTNIYKLAGNSIVVSCLYYIFRNLFTPQDMPTQTRQLSLF